MREELKVVELVRKHINPKVFWRVLSLQEQKRVLQELFRDICQLYGVKGVELVVDIDPLKKARLWSHKVFYLAFPELYMKNVREGKFFHSFPIEEIMQFNEGLR